MREEHKLNKAIKRDGINAQSDILDELKRRYPQYVEQRENKPAAARKRKFALISAIVAVVACVAVIVPCAVLLPNRNAVDNSGKSNDRYCTQDEYEKVEVQYTIAEYRANNKRNFLYFDWYEAGEDCKTFAYTSNSNNEVLGLEENIYRTQTNEFVQLSITKSNIYLSVFDSIKDYCDTEQVVSNYTVKWAIKDAKAFCIFEDNGYRYYIQILRGRDKNRLFELVAELLDNK